MRAAEQQPNFRRGKSPGPYEAVLIDQTTFITFVTSELTETLGEVYDNRMSAFQVDLPPDLGRFVEEKVRKGGFKSASEFLTELVRDHQIEESLTPDGAEELREEIRAGMDDVQNGRVIQTTAREIIDRCRKNSGNRI